MLRVDGDHANWVLVVILVMLALLLAMVSSTAYSDVQQANPQAAPRADQAKQPWQPAAQDRKELRTASEVWYVARELYQAGRVEEARGMFEKVVARCPSDPAALMWAGMAAFRTGDRATAIRHWNAVWCDEAPVLECGVWPAVALAAAELESGRPDRAARFIVPLERGDYGFEFADHPVVSFYAALVYEQLAIAAPKYREAVEESLAEKFSPALASSDGSLIVSPNSQSWLLYLTKRALQRTIRGARSIDRAAPVVPESATVEPSFAPTVGELLESLGSADFASQARRKLRALELYQSPPNRRPEIFDDPELIKRGRFIA
jgi:tetratricopeptide (TPR) repeat protein